MEEAAEGVDVGPAVDWVAADLFGRYVADRPDELSRQKIPVEKRRSGHAEVGEVRPLFVFVFVFVLVQQDVGRLDVSVDEPVRVGGIERGGELRHERHGSGRFEAALFAQQAGEIAARQLHGDEQAPLVFPHLVDGEDAPVNHRRGQPRLALGAFLSVALPVRVGCDQLEGDRLVAARAGRAVDDGCAASAEHLLDGVARDHPLRWEQAERAHRAAEVIDQR